MYFSGKKIEKIKSKQTNNNELPEATVGCIANYLIKWKTIILYLKFPQTCNVSLFYFMFIMCAWVWIGVCVLTFIHCDLPLPGKEIFHNKNWIKNKERIKEKKKKNKGEWKTGISFLTNGATRSISILFIVSFLSFFFFWLRPFCILLILYDHAKIIKIFMNRHSIQY